MLVDLRSKISEVVLVRADDRPPVGPPVTRKEGLSHRGLQGTSFALPFYLLLFVQR